MTPKAVSKSRSAIFARLAQTDDFSVEALPAGGLGGKWYKLCFRVTMQIGIRVLFYMKYYLLPQLSFGLFIVAEGVYLYGLYSAFVAS